MINKVHPSKNTTRYSSRNFCKYLPVEIAGHLLLGLVDSGNIFYNVMSESLANNLKLKIRKYNGPIVGTAKSGEFLDVTGIVKNVNLYVYDVNSSKYKLKSDFVIMPQLTCGINISLPFLIRNKLDQLHSEHALYFTKKRVKLPLFKGKEHAERASPKSRYQPSLLSITDITHNGYASEKRIIPPHSGISLIVKLNKKVPQIADTLFSFSDQFLSKLTTQLPTGHSQPIHLGINSIDQAVSLDNDHQFKLFIFNETGTPLTITKGTKVGFIHVPENQPVSVDINSICSSETIATDSAKWYNNIPSNQLKKRDFAKRQSYIQEIIGYENNPYLRKNPKIATSLVKLLLTYWDVFYREGNCGGTDAIEHPVYTPKGLPPIRLKNRPINPGLIDDLKEQIATWIKDGVIRSGGVSPWNFPLLPVRKKNGKWRWVVDFRLLNSVTRKDSFPIPNIVELLSYLSKSKYFTSLDLAQAFHSIPVREVDREKLSFCALDKFYQFCRMPFGLTSAPNTWARLVTKVLHEIPKSQLVVFFDDLLVHSPDLSTHLKTLEKVMKLLHESGLRLNLEKTDWIKGEVKFLGHLISREGIKVPPEFSQIIRDWPLPVTLKDLRSFLGKCNYYRNHFKNFAITAAPLMAHLKGASESSRKLDLKKDPLAVKSFESLKTLLSSPELLAYPDFESNQPFLVDTDYSHDGIGAVLSQIQNGTEKPIAFSARRLKTSESQYASHKGELLALIFAIDQFKFFLTGRKFLVRTDNSALSWLKNQKDPKGILMRWLRILSTYEFDIQHRAGIKHGNADALSRASHAPELSLQESKDLLADDDQILAIGSDHNFYSSENESDPEIETDDNNAPNEEEFDIPEIVDSPTLSEQQHKDEILSKVITWVKNQTKPTGQEYKLLSSEEKFYADYFEYLFLAENGVLMRKPIPFTKDRTDKIILPATLQTRVLQSLHYKNHSSGKILADNVELRYSFPKIPSICRRYVLECTRCQKLAKRKSQRHTYEHDLVGSPGEKISIDFVGPLIPTKRGYRSILTIVDTYTKWFCAWPVKRQTAETVIKHLVNDYIPNRGIPAVVHSDNGPAFVAKIFQEALNEFDIRGTTTPVYNPKSNMVERYHRTMKRRLTAIMHEFNNDWDEALPAVVFFMRTSVHQTTGYTPFFLEHGREARLPIHLAIGDPPHQPALISQYVKRLREIFKTAYSQVSEKQHTYIMRQRELYRERQHKIVPGDLVWLYTERPDPSLNRKFQSFWSGPYTVLLQVTNTLFKIESYGRWTTSPVVTTVAVDRLKKCYHADPDTNLGIPVSITSEDVRPYYDHQELLGRIPISDMAPHIFGRQEVLPCSIQETPPNDIQPNTLNPNIPHNISVPRTVNSSSAPNTDVEMRNAEGNVVIPLSKPPSADAKPPEDMRNDQGNVVIPLSKPPPVPPRTPRNRYFDSHQEPIVQSCEYDSRVSNARWDTSEVPPSPDPSFLEVSQDVRGVNLPLTSSPSTSKKPMVQATPPLSPIKQRRRIPLAAQLPESLPPGSPNESRTQAGSSPPQGSQPSSSKEQPPPLRPRVPQPGTRRTASQLPPPIPAKPLRSNDQTMESVREEKFLTSARKVPLFVSQPTSAPPPRLVPEESGYCRNCDRGAHNQCPLHCNSCYKIRRCHQHRIPRADCVSCLPDRPCKVHCTKCTRSTACSRHSS